MTLNSGPVEAMSPTLVRRNAAYNIVVVTTEFGYCTAVSTSVITKYPLFMQADKSTAYTVQGLSEKTIKEIFSGTRCIEARAYHGDGGLVSSR